MCPEQVWLRHQIHQSKEKKETEVSLRTEAMSLEADLGNLT